MVNKSFFIDYFSILRLILKRIVKDRALFPGSLKFIYKASGAPVTLVYYILFDIDSERPKRSEIEHNQIIFRKNRISLCAAYIFSMHCKVIIRDGNG